MNLAFRLFPTLLTLVLIIVAACAGNASAANLVTNGNFTQFVAGDTLSSAGGFICQDTGNSTCTSNLTDWISDCDSSCGTSATAASVLVHGKDGTAFNCCGLWEFDDDPNTTGNYIAIDGDRTYGAWIAQSISGLVVGATYQLSFDMAAAQQDGTTGATNEWWQVTFNPTQGAGTVYSTTELENPSHGFTGWDTITMTLTATSATEWLQFYADSTSAGMPPVVLLDNVSLVQVAPEPKTLALMLAAVLGIAAMKRIHARKKRSVQ